MRIIEFIKKFPNEKSCRLDFKMMREEEGVICKKCKGKHHYWLAKKWQWQCSKCEFRTTLRSGTFMENSNLSFHKWYIAMCMMSFTKKGISAVELQRQLGQKRYESTWRMMHKIREAMGKRDERYTLKGMVEFDEGYFETATPKLQSSPLKRGRGSRKQQNVAVMAESTPLEDIDKGTVSNQCRYFKMKVLPTHDAQDVNELVQENFDKQCIVFSDKSTSYVDIAKYVETHITEKSSNETTNTTLKWVHITISNAKRTLLGIYHKIQGKYLQSYLNEFCYKLNRRYFGNQLFERLKIALINNYWYNYG
ncbi:MAG: IS1595 family transposase [Bacteroidetes bacterium]|nr:IS1595 family transposase [Bacteroidota bacterium]